MPASTVITDTRRRTIATNPAGSPHDRAGSPSAGHPAAPPTTATVPDADAPAASVECPECGGPSTSKPIATWGHCRACRTADSRAVQPLRW